MFSRTERLIKAYETKTSIVKSLNKAKGHCKDYEWEAKLNAFFTVLAALIALVSIPVTYGAFGEDGLLMGGIFTALFGAFTINNSLNWEESIDNRKFWEEEVEHLAKELKGIKTDIDRIENVRKDYCSHGIYLGFRVKENGSIRCGLCE